MKKRIISLILTLVMAIGFVSVLSACGKKDESEPELATAVNDQYVDEILDICEVVGTIDPQEKQIFSGYVKEIVLQNEDFINGVGEKVVYPAGITTKKLTNFLTAIKEYLESEIAYEEYVLSLTEKYEKDFYALIEGVDLSQCEALQNCGEFFEFVLNHIIYGNDDVTDEDFEYIIYYYVSAMEEELGVIIDAVDTSELLALIDKIVTAEKTTAVAKKQDLKLKNKNLLDSIYAEDVCAFLINLVYEFDNLGFDKLLGISESGPETVWSGFVEKLETVKNTFNELGLNDSKKKEAYLKLVSFVFGEMIESEKILLEVDASAEFDLSISLIKLPIQQDYVSIGSAEKGLTEYLKSVGKVISSRAKSKKNLEKDVVEACKTLNDGLGYYADRFVPLYLAFYDFMGSALSTVKTDDLAYGFLTLYMNDFTAEDVVYGNEELYKVAEIFGYNFESILANMNYKDWFVSSVNKALNNSNPMTLLLKSTGELKDCYGIDYSKSANFGKLSEEDQNKIESAYSDLLISLEAFVTGGVKGEIQVATESLKTFLQPMGELVEYIGTIMDGYFGSADY